MFLFAQMKASDESDESSTLATAKNMKLLLEMARTGTNSKQGLFYETELVSSSGFNLNFPSF